MKITAFDPVYGTLRSIGGTTLVTSDGSNSGFGGDVVGTSGNLSVVGLRSKVSLTSNLTGSVGDALTLISASPLVAQFATPSNSGASFGSNSTRISETASAGAATTASRADHIHDGIGTVTASSSNTMQRGTLNLRAGSNVSFGLTDSDGSGALDTLTINSTAAGGGGVGTSGALILLEQHTASSSATLDFTTAISSTYDEYVFEIVNVLPATNGVNMLMRVGTGAGPTWDTGSNYAYANFQVDSGASTGARSSAGTTSYEVANVVDSTSTGGLSGTVRLYGPANGSKHPNWTCLETRLTGGAQVSGSGGGRLLATTALTGVQFLMSSGNVASGVIRCYGVSK